MDYAILGDTYSDLNINYFTQGVSVSGKAAKLNQATKRPALVNNWETKRPNLLAPNQANDLAQMNQMIREVASSNYGYDVVLNGLGLTLKESDLNSSITGFRKLKVNNLVKDKTKKVYDNSNKEKIVVPVVDNKISSNVEIPVMEEKRVEKEVKAPVVNTPNPSYTAMEPVADTRSSRYERNLENNIPVQTNVINTPERFVTRSEAHKQISEEEKKPMVNTLSRVDRRNDDYSTKEENHVEKVKVGKSEQDLNMISEKIHGSNNTLNNDLQEAYNKYVESEKNKKSMLAEQLELEKAVQEAKELLNQKHAQEIADLNARTQANEEETLEYTMHSEDLKQQLAELRSQLAGSSFRR